MIELKITGANAQELFVNAVQTLNLVVKGGMQTITQQAAAPQAEMSTAPQPDKFPASDDVGAAEKAATKAKPGTRNKGQPAPAPTEAPASASDNKADFLDDAAKPAETKTEITIADCRTQVRLSLENYEKRAREKLPKGLSDAQRAEAEKQIMFNKVEYTKPLLSTFGVGKVSDLKPEQFAEFMKVSKAYVNGTAPDPADAD